MLIDNSTMLIDKKIGKKKLGFCNSRFAFEMQTLDVNDVDEFLNESTIMEGTDDAIRQARKR